MAELDHVSTQAEQARGHRGDQMLLGYLVREEPCRRDDLADGPAVVQRSDEQERACLPWKLVGPRAERVLETIAERQRPRQQPTFAVVVANHPGQLDQRQRVARGRIEHARPDADREVGRHGVEQRGRVLSRQRIQAELIQAQLIEAARNAVTDGEHGRHGLAAEPPRQEGKHVRGCRVQPLRILDDHQDWSVGGHLRQQLEGAECYQEAIRRRVAVESEGGGHRRSQAAGETIEAVQRRREQGMEPCERQVGLRAHARCRNRPEAAPNGPTGELGEQSRLPDARVAANDERSTALADLQQTVEKVELTLAPVQALGRGGGKRCVVVEVRLHAVPSRLDPLAG
jgi:hypothetical protein